jgi:hypothetical protein
MKSVRLMAIVCSALAVCAYSAGGAPANAAAIAGVNSNVAISAGQGWLVWSVPVTGGWGLEAYHDNQLSALPIAPVRSHSM